MNQQLERASVLRLQQVGTPGMARLDAAPAAAQATTEADMATVT